MSNTSEIIQSRNVLEMLTVAHEFCLFTEDLKSKSKLDILSYYQKVLPLLYIKGSLVPQIKLDDLSANEKFVTAEHWEEIYTSLNEKLGKNDSYWYTDDLNETVKGSFSDNIADIYQDMKDFVLLFQKNLTPAKENAVNDLRTLFIVHWGQIISKVIPHLHRQIYGKEIEQNEQLIY